MCPMYQTVPALLPDVPLTTICIWNHMLKSVYVLMNYQAHTGKRVLNTPRLTCQPATHPTGRAKRGPDTGWQGRLTVGLYRYTVIYVSSRWCWQHSSRTSGNRKHKSSNHTKELERDLSNSLIIPRHKCGCENI